MLCFSAHIYGTSQHNQRIESWWSVLRKMWIQIWMNLFDDLESYAKLALDNYNCKTVLNFCFSIVIQQELQNFVKQ